MAYAFIKYWVEGTKEAVHQLYEAIEKNTKTSKQ